ncbi:MAG: mannonate dehydratase [Chloroflexi bacterium]|nr:mannonate dehydratase [Chloroflexota bacterium]
MRFLLSMERASDEKLRFAAQIGVDAVGAAPAACDLEKGYYEFAPLVALRSQVESYGLKLEIINLPPWRWSYKWMLGLPGRDEQIENCQKTIRNLGAAGIPIFMYNIHALRFFRTSWHVPQRGGALATGFDVERAKTAPLMVAGSSTRAGDPLIDTDLIPAAHRRPISDEEMWDNLTYFLKGVVPVAEEAGVKLAMHPDDPPIPVVGGVARIMRSPEAFRRAIEIVPSECNGLTFCQGCFAEMGADVVKEIRYFGSRKKIFLVHFRNVAGTAENFAETFPDNGQVDMVEAMRAYAEIGYDGAMSPDHPLRLEGDGDWSQRYWAYAIGYMRGLAQAVDSKR